MRQVIPCGFNLTGKVFEINNQLFIMIPKNASNTILFGTEFQSISRKFSKIKNYEREANVFIRDPLSRFEAGLIESIKRCSPFILDNYVASRSSVPSSDDLYNIYNNIFDELNQNSTTYILKIIKLLSKSFYDPHLCPQWYFFTSLDCRTRSQIKLFLLDDLNNIMDSLNLPIKQNLNENSFFDTDKYRKNNFTSPKRFIKKLIKRNLKSLNKFFVDFYFLLNPSSTLCSPSLNPVFNFINFKEWESSKVLIKNAIKNDDEIINGIKNLYSQDWAMYQILKEKRELILPKYYNIHHIYDI